MSAVVSPSVSRVCGLVRVCSVWRVSRATLYRRRHPKPGEPRHRPGPTGPMTDAELVEAIRELLAESTFHGEGYRKIWARLRFKGIRTSKRRVLRLTREHGLQAPHRLGRPRGPRAHDGTIRTDRVDEMWGTELTSMLTGEVQAAVFILVDHCSGKCLGIHAAHRDTRFRGPGAATPGRPPQLRRFRQGRRPTLTARSPSPASCAAAEARASSPTATSRGSSFSCSIRTTWTRCCCLWASSTSPAPGAPSVSAACSRTPRRWCRRMAAVT